jgi:hypothetical protein
MYLWILTKMSWSSFFAIFSKANLVALLTDKPNQNKNRRCRIAFTIKNSAKVKIGLLCASSRMSTKAGRWVCRGRCKVGGAVNLRVSTNLFF